MVALRARRNGNFATIHFCFLNNDYELLLLSLLMKDINGDRLHLSLINAQQQRVTCPGLVITRCSLCPVTGYRLYEFLIHIRGKRKEEMTREREREVGGLRRVALREKNTIGRSKNTIISLRRNCIF